MRMMTLAAHQGGDVTTARVAASPGRTEGGRAAAALRLGWLADVERRAVAKRGDAFGRCPVPVVDEALGGGDPLEEGQVARRARDVAPDDPASRLSSGGGDPQDHHARPRILGPARDT